MKQVSLCLGLALLGMAALASTAVPRAAARDIGDMLGELQWGDSREDVLKHWTETIRGRYHEQVIATDDALKQDHLREAMRRDLQALQQGFVAFDGHATGWDASFLRDEFVHGNGESVLVVKEQGHQHFYFFHHDRLWKTYSALDSSLAANQPYHVFVRQLRTQVGKNGAIRQGQMLPGGSERRWVEWQDGRNRLRAMDETRFYGFYGLVIEDQRAGDRIERARQALVEPTQGKHSLVELVVVQDESAPVRDAHADIADQITGKTRRR